MALKLSLPRAPLLSTTNASLLPDAAGHHLLQCASKSTEALAIERAGPVSPIAAGPLPTSVGPLTQPPEARPRVSTWEHLCASGTAPGAGVPSLGHVQVALKVFMARRGQEARPQPCFVW
ncbi:hypothetical protein P7K49_026095 [Saguinus oedipus]|uniref:Uncharacterized protein n=1 Tax=Saguinus oedipus TaxID=9490 RepID=A0ABQ9UJ15_SAGOE|nr:hypothetical protein P7K49_026095 [Saguinus oedipus]